MGTGVTSPSSGSNHSVKAIIGPGCSTACEVTSYLAAALHLPQISYSCTDPLLSNKDPIRGHPYVRDTVDPAFFCWI